MKIYDGIEDPEMMKILHKNRLKSKKKRNSFSFNQDSLIFLDCIVITFFVINLIIAYWAIMTI